MAATAQIVPVNACFAVKCDKCGKTTWKVRSVSRPRSARDLVASWRRRRAGASQAPDPAAIRAYERISELLGHVLPRCGHSFVTSVLTVFLFAQGCGAHVDSVSIHIPIAAICSQDALYASPRSFVWGVMNYQVAWFWGAGRF